MCESMLDGGDDQATLTAFYTQCRAARMDYNIYFVLILLSFELDTIGEELYTGIIMHSLDPLKMRT